MPRRASSIALTLVNISTAALVAQYPAAPIATRVAMEEETLMIRPVVLRSR